MNKSMAKINLPKETLQKESFKSLPAKEKDEYLNNLLVKILQLNPDGITTSQIKEVTGITYSTIWHHLELLSCTAQSNKSSRGNVNVYYPCGNATHLNDYSSGNTTYSISAVKNTKGAFVCMHEKKENRTGSSTVCSGISIPIEIVEKVIDSLNKAKKSAK